MAEITVTLSGDKEAMERLRRIGGGVLDLSSPMSSIGRYLTGFFSGEVFASRGGVIGKSWRPLNNQYAARKARTFPGRPPLIRTGVMNRSFKANAGRASVLLLNSDPKFAFHQSGTSRIPARTMMAVDQTRERRIVDIIDAHLGRVMGAA
jgi:phage gpG-like protein